MAHEVEAMGGRSIACRNARDGNLLGLRRDLLTAAAYGVDQFLFVAGVDSTRDLIHRIHDTGAGPRGRRDRPPSASQPSETAP